MNNDSFALIDCELNETRALKIQKLAIFLARLFLAYVNTQALFDLFTV